MARAPDLSEQLVKVKCMEGKKFVPLDILEKVVTVDNVAKQLEILSRGQSDFTEKVDEGLPKKVVQQASKVFAVLLLMEKTEYIESLLEADLSDRYLPLSIDQTGEILKSCDGSTLFSFGNWSRLKKGDFEDEQQWLFLAPVLDTSGQLLKLDPRCPLPFIDSSIKETGGAGIIHHARVHEAHQRGYVEETFDLQVAVKQFVKRKEFETENKNLQSIKFLQHKHIIRHLVSINQGNGFTVFPWADRGNLHQFWDAAYDQEMSTEYALWALQQMQGLAAAVDMLHQTFNCRHGDLKPGNILCFTQGVSSGNRSPLPTLKIADFGISRIHTAQTMMRDQKTTTMFLTPAYQGPEVEFEEINDEKPHPRSRKYDIWSLGCIYLEFMIWFLYGPNMVYTFDITRGTTEGSKRSNPSSPWYEVTNRAAKMAKVHQLVAWTIENIQNDPRCMGDTVLATLIGIIRDHMLQPDVNKRLSAGEISHKLEGLALEGEKHPDSLLHTCSGETPKLDFKTFIFEWPPV
ncbi:protein kinase domain containing protein [Grosmannia clavigera kw1407]|uniref:Protein kinase domain containing protein n=1 Tax=Grosmannia clavigera (strain kw1407 / UAMH 11150) TaxID=655863 RepID=F0XEA7_GROCL|nr:protein kinase domain containing protein [Grosmannia clavigera kw1407]EFX04244.1 protein kinase domain containing protein [Grosmannia clavigera kw1407]